MVAPAPRVAAPAVALVVALSCALSGCAPSPDRPRASPESSSSASSSPAASVVRSGTGEVRHDLAPLTDRFTQLAGATSATWLSGTLGDGRVPGPSTYWIDAVVVLDDAGFAELRALAPAESGSVEQRHLPELDPGLDDALPAGPFVRSEALDDEFSQDGRDTQVFLDDATRSMILTSRFE